MPKTDVRVKLTGEDGNAFAIMGAVRGALERNGYEDLAAQYIEDAIMGDYNHLLMVSMDYVEVE
jgi:hypothetical protein